ncbi:T9SS type A sorting domain-containing protein [Winogradskyella echinorum]|uniref:T9SS type A sorting domain-containing protein n=1 Tax=Winogradskyella echinorum TaxID=538189 RepID=A0ABR6Y451_9FLAO|nr:T9SS type A sorting domain-containing protein [Winogradskyella echinorum]MBC3847516.1 T9SS type A sorting domain-containing protein [Winogradskyella echinorum]MBC5751864.1 T9SS type A sorting domain-containing protein [Winogradskyella echinorum]
MKNTLHSQLFYFSNCYFNFKKKLSVLLLFSALFLVSNLAHAQLPQFYDFESGFQGWTNNGNDSGRYQTSGWRCNGSFSIFSKDDQTNNNIVTSPSLNLSSYNTVSISLCHKSSGLDNGEGFRLQFFDGSNWQTVRTFVIGTDFFNNGTGNPHYLASIISSSDYTFATNSRFRFSGTANSNSEWNFFDDIEIEFVPPPANDDCANAISLTSGEFCSPTLGTTAAASQSLSGCSGTANDDVWYSFTATGINHNVIVEPTSLSNAVIEVFDNCGGTSLGCENSTSGNSSEILSLTGLTIGNVYYVRVYSHSNGSGEFNICIVEPCSPSNDVGTSTLGCPFVDLGGVGLGSTAPPPVDCSVGEVTLEATYLELGDTNDYTVESIPYNPPFQFGCLANPVSVNLDDIWSPVVNLPFDFCFYGNTYNSCVIGSNGVISFDTSLANSSSGWYTSRNIPNTINAEDGNGTYFFGPSIFGVHHDVDPSVGGEIGYQLITLDTGCRALVAAWADVPMYFDNSILYTGMIVFYEDTNVIEVYVKEKNIDGGNPWNGGNASIGLQERSNSGISAPGRNTNDTNWTATEEAWRFVPDGASITTLKWYEGSISAANEITDPNNDNQITVSPNSSTTYFAEVTYTLCNGSTIVQTSSTDVTITGNKTWNGSQSTDWDDADNWTPNGVPTIDDCITIPPTSNNPRLNSPTNGLGYNMQILDGADLLHRPNATLTIDDRIVIEPNGNYRLRTNASLIQINDVAANENIGDAEVRRRVNGVGYFDYVYWSSPVSNFNVLDISPGSPSHSIFDWNPSVANGTAGRHGTWTNTTEDMISGKGYIVRGLLGTPASDQAQFEGTLNNGQISYPISRGTYTGADYAGIGNTATAEDDNWNLLGNPYPSAISLSDFIAANPAIDGTLYFWRHIDPAATAIDDPFYEGYQYNYNPNDYLSANSLGSTPSGFNGYIASGQGFFALMLDSAPTPNVVNFNNTMRGLYANNVFYRNSSPTGLENKHRIWLDLVNEDNTALPILIGFADGATNGIDRLYDGISINQSENQFYSLASDKKLSIQGKPLPFDNSETIPLGYKTAISGSFKITINKLDGLFEGASQDIFIEDTKLNIIHNLKDSPYSFTTDEGTYNNRFIVRFTPQALSINDQDIIADLNIKSINKTINVRSTLSLIKTFELFDLTGRTIHKNVNIDNNTYNYQDNNLSAGAYIVQVTLFNGSVVSKKIVI